MDAAAGSGYHKAMIKEAEKGSASRPYHHGDLKTALVAAARDLLEREGLAGLSLRGVARAAGVSQAAPYHHFADKDALLAAVAAEGFRELTVAMAARREKATGPGGRLREIGVGYVLFAVANPALFRLMFRGNEGDAALAEAGGEAYDLMRRAVGEAIGAGEPSGIAETAAWAMVHGLAKLVLEAGVTPERAGAEDVEDLARRVLSTLSLTQGSLTAGDDAL